MIAELKNVNKSYGEGGGVVDVLTGLDFSLGDGETAAVVGASGCGKSTLLNVIGTLDEPTSGEVRLFGDDVRALGEKEQARLRATKLGFIFQMHHLLPQCTVLENVLVPTLALGPGEGGNELRARDLLEKVGLAHRVSHLPGELSGGERQRAAVVRALINSPEILLADEPTGALDETNAAALADLLLEMNREEGVAIVLVSHDVPLARRMSKVYELAGGKLTVAGTTS